MEENTMHLAAVQTREDTKLTGLYLLAYITHTRTHYALMLKYAEKRFSCRLGTVTSAKFEMGTMIIENMIECILCIKVWDLQMKSKISQPVMILIYLPSTPRI